MGLRGNSCQQETLRNDADFERPESLGCQKAIVESLAPAQASAVPDHLVVDARAGLDDAADDVHVIGPIVPLASDTTDAEAEPAGMVASAPTLTSPEAVADDPR